jgi:hypothetical protein
VKNRFQDLPFKCNLRRYTEDNPLIKDDKARQALGALGGALHVESS